MLKIVGILMILFCSLGSAFAWDDTGHKLTAYIAWQRMTPQVREAVVKILLAAPEDSSLSMFYLQDSRSEAIKQRELFMIAATWADIVRDRKFDVRSKKYHHGDWHYSDTFWQQTNGKPELLPKMEASGKALEKLVEYEKVLRDSSVPDKDKAIAIAWFEHLTGDIAQPLHASGKVTELEPKGDQGGNTFSLSPKDTPREKSTNLHGYWDSIVGRAVPRKNDACDTDYLPAIGDAMMKKFPFAKEQTHLELGQFDQWGKDSYLLATTDVYSPDLKRYEMPSAKYQKNAYAVAEEQIALAGYRMGETLNQIFGAAPAAANVSASNSTGDCFIIRRIDYPVTPTDTGNKKQEIGLLNLCPANPGQVARPMYQTLVNGNPVMREYDVQKVFKNEREARDYAEKNNVKDISL